MSHSDRWIATLNGRKCWISQPRLEAVAIDEIVNGLVNCPRFHGQTRPLYSTAQHSVLVWRYCEREALKPHALLHDATDFILPDWAHPVKSLMWVETAPGMMERFSTVEERLLGIIWAHFGLELPVPGHIHQVDRRVLATEARDLMGDPQDWPALSGVQPYPEPITPWPPCQAEAVFRAAFATLDLPLPQPVAVT